MNCVFTESAERDLEEIGDYIALDNPQRAISFIAELRSRCEKIVDAPKGGTLAPDLGRGVRRVPYGNYVIFYSVSDDEIVVIHVLHGARNITAGSFKS